MKYIYSFSIALFFLVVYSPCFSQSWSALGSGTNGARVNAIVVDSTGDLYAGGDFYKAGGLPAEGIAKWNGTDWSSLGTGVDGQVLVLKIFNGKLFVGGEFINAGGQQVNCIAIWDGSQWQGFGQGMLKTGGHTFTTSVRDMAMYKGELYAAGVFDYADGKKASLIARWSGAAWEAVGIGISGNYINTLTVYNDELYVGGSFTSAGGVPAKNIAKWNGTSWAAVGEGFNNYVNVLKENNGVLYAAGGFTASGATATKYIARLDGETWTPLASGTNLDISSLAFWDGKLIAGGYFTTAGGVTANRIAAFDGTAWTTLGTGMDDFIKTLHIDMASHILYAGGGFLKAGGSPANHIARFQLITGINETDSELHTFSSFPQPAADAVTILIPDNLAFKARLIVITDLTGKVILKAEVAEETIIPIARGALPAGIYAYSIYSINGILGNGSIIFE
ncbi:MAG: T9SS type A sorting domain-containing protein [Bacteroidota bacterium]